MSRLFDWSGNVGTATVIGEDDGVFHAMMVVERDI